MEEEPQFPISIMFTFEMLLVFSLALVFSYCSHPYLLPPLAMSNTIGLASLGTKANISAQTYL